MVITRRVFSRVAWMILAALLVAGCDKCGHPVKLNAPSLPGTCGENAEPAR